MKYLKTYENINNYLLCVKSTDPDFHWKFTKGNKYKVYKSSHGTRVKDNNNNFTNIDHWNIKLVNGEIYEYRYADGILTKDKTLEDYYIRKSINKYNL